MQLKQQVTDSQAIVYDADRIQQPDARLFEPGYWDARKAIVGKARGRGNVLLLETSFGPAVLRQYMRGGFAARLSRDRYLFLGYSSSRPIAEANMLVHLAALGLPVPGVLAAVCSRLGFTYSGALLTRRIPESVPLADLLHGLGCNNQLWPEVGACVRRFHDAGVNHVDLNVRNILVDNQQKVWLIDFDRARLIRPGSRQLASNLARLKRSLAKENKLDSKGLEVCWSKIMAGYTRASEQGGVPGVEEKTQAENS